MSRSITIIINIASGHNEKDELLENILGRLTAAGIPASAVRIGKGEDVEGKAEPAVLKAKADNGIVVAAGGDGTINSVAGLCYKHGVTLGVLPLGTYNYFARDLGIPLETEGAVDVLIAQNEKSVAIGLIEGRVFLVNASIGLYTDIIETRERYKAKLGRYRFVALVATVVSLFRAQKHLTCKVKSAKEEISQKALAVFIGNNALQLENIGLTPAEHSDPDALAIIIVKRMTLFQKCRMLFWAMFRNLRVEERVDHYTATDFTIETSKKYVTAVLDGEIMNFTSPLVFQAKPGGLKVIAPIKSAP